MKPSESVYAKTVTIKKFNEEPYVSKADFDDLRDAHIRAKDTINYVIDKWFNTIEQRMEDQDRLIKLLTKHERAMNRIDKLQATITKLNEKIAVGQAQVQTQGPIAMTPLEVGPSGRLRFKKPEPAFDDGPAKEPSVLCRACIYAFIDALNDPELHKQCRHRSAKKDPGGYLSCAENRDSGDCGQDGRHFSPGNAQYSPVCGDCRHREPVSLTNLLVAGNCKNNKAIMISGNKNKMSCYSCRTHDVVRVEDMVHEVCGPQARWFERKGE